MAKHRWVDTKFWEDNYIINLLPEEKLLFMYFLTSPRTNICGVYECPLKLIAVHTGFDRDNLETILKRFEGKIHYIDGWVYIRNFLKHQSTDSPQVKKGIEREMEDVPAKVKVRIAEIDRQFGSDDSLFSFDEATEQLEDAKKQDDADNEFMERWAAYYKEKINPRALFTPGTRKRLRTRMKEFSSEQLIEAIDNFAGNSWRMANNSKKGMEWFLRSEDQVYKWLELEPEESEKVSGTLQL